MEGEIPKPAIYIGGAILAAVVLAKVMGGGSSASADVKNFGPVTDPNSGTIATAKEQARTSAFGSLTSAFTSILNTQTTGETQTVLGGIQQKISESTNETNLGIAQANAASNDLKTATALKIAQTQAGASVTNAKTASKTSTWGKIIDVGGSIIGGALKIFGL